MVYWADLELTTCLDLGLNCSEEQLLSRAKTSLKHRAVFRAAGSAFGLMKPELGLVWRGPNSSVVWGRKVCNIILEHFIRTLASM